MKPSPSGPSFDRVAHRGQRGQRGAATLVVVMVLFFIMALVAVYTSRNLIFEQRTSSNQYRSSQAFEAAEAGVEWALAMLNGGRVDSACLPTTDTTQSSFRARYIDTIDSESKMTVRTQPPGPGFPATPAPALMPACVFDAATNPNLWRCHCPSDSATVLPVVGGAAAKPMFRVRFEYLSAPATRRDVLRIVSAGCNRPDPACLAETPSAPPGDAMAVVTSVVALRSALSTLPGAAITAQGDVNAGTGSLAATNTNPATGGITVLAGGGILGTVLPTTLAGTPGDKSMGASDDALAALAIPDRMFNNFFGMAPLFYEEQPGAFVLDCSAGCNSANVNSAVAQNPGHVIWIEGDLTVNGDIGTAPVGGGLLASELPSTGPVMLVVEGTATLASGTLYGALYGRVLSWNRGSGTALVQGALIAEGGLVGNGNQQVIYDPAILSLLRTRQGSFVRVPGGWKDF
ncbi:MAG: hypothetical protein H7Z19_10375 [Chitinophagaceae bacterium]|nr:hypothetical protein [Rubrivivax sp.]